MAAAGDEGHRYTVADLEPHHALAGRHHFARELVSRNMRQTNIRVMAFPARPVATAEARRADRDNDAVKARLRVGERPDSGVCSKAS